MNTEVKQAWLAALRSGEYGQGQQRLRQDNLFCCLGVLCDLAAKAGVGRWRRGMGFDDFDDGDELVSTSLPSSVAAWAGLDASSPSVAGAQLVYLNDSSLARRIRPHTFAEIADLIEAYL